MGLMLGLLEGFAGLGMILALAEWFGVCALAPFVTRTGIPVSLGSLGGDLRAALANVPAPDDRFESDLADALGFVTNERTDPWADA